MIWLYFCLTIPSLALVNARLGSWGVVAYLVAVGLTLPLVRRIRMSETQAHWLGIGTLFFVLAAFLVAYPFAQSGVFGWGSDSDDAFNVSVGQLLHGHFPYYVRTYLGNVIHPLPGALLLALPFVVMGNAAYQDLFWLAVFFYVACREAGSTRRALLLLWALLGLCPEVIHAVVTGNDQLVNGIYPLVALWLMMRKNSVWAAVFFGVSLSSRANFLFLAPLAFAWLLKEYGMPRAVRDLSIATVTFLAVTLPLYLFDPKNFTPLDAADRLTDFDYVLPHLSLWLGVAAVLLTIGFAAFKPRSPLANFALVQAFFVVSEMLMWGDLEYSGYGLFFLFFGSLQNVGALSGPLQDLAGEGAQVQRACDSQK